MEKIDNIINDILSKAKKYGLHHKVQTTAKRYIKEKNIGKLNAYILAFCNLLKVLLILVLFTFSSCMMMNNVTDAELKRNNEITYELDKLWAEYEYKRDSLLIELYKD